MVRLRRPWRRAFSYFPLQSACRDAGYSFGVLSFTMGYPILILITYIKKFLPSEMQSSGNTMQMIGNLGSCAMLLVFHEITRAYSFYIALQIKWLPVPKVFEQSLNGGGGAWCCAVCM